MPGSRAQLTFPQNSILADIFFHTILLKQIEQDKEIESYCMQDRAHVWTANLPGL